MSVCNIKISGLRSLVQSSYVNQIGTKFNLSSIKAPIPANNHYNHGQKRNAENANFPKMYTTEYQHYAGNKPVRV